MKFDDLKKTVAPDPTFNARAKGRFLVAFDAHYGTRPGEAQKRGITAFAKFFITAGAFAALLVSVSAYADTANVAANNPLYPLKRLSENVRLALASQNAQAGLEAQFATRRANEIAALATSNPSSTLIPKLSADFKNDVSSSLGSVEADTAGGAGGESGQFSPQVATGTAESSTPEASEPRQPQNTVKPEEKPQVMSVCEGVASALSASAVVPGALINNASLLARFENACGTSISVSSSASGASGISASTTIFVMPSSKDPGDSSSSNPSGAAPTPSPYRAHIPVPVNLFK